MHNGRLMQYFSVKHVRNIITYKVVFYCMQKLNAFEISSNYCRSSKLYMGMMLRMIIITCKNRIICGFSAQCENTIRQKISIYRHQNNTNIYLTRQLPCMVSLSMKMKFLTKTLIKLTLITKYFFFSAFNNCLLVLYLLRLTFIIYISLLYFKLDLHF